MQLESIRHMDITWHGHSAFTIKGDKATIVTDPYDGLGTKLPTLKANILALGDVLAQSKGTLAKVEGEPKTLDWPGEFEVSGVSIEAFSAKRFATDEGVKGEDVNLFVFVVDGIKICYLSGLSHDLSDELIDSIGDVDILLLPVGGGDVLEGKVAQKLMEAIEARIVIPMYYAATKTDLNLSDAGEFLKAVGKTELQAEAKYSIKGRSALPEGVMEFVILEPQV